jgi:hypothetical protein
MLREPLIHFLLIGAAIFGLYGTGRDGDVSASSDRIVVARADVDRLSGLWEKRWQRPPDASELEDLIQEHVREEVLYREALALGLDRDDTVVRRHLRQKFEFVTQDIAAAREPDSDELSAYYEANIEHYRTAPRFSFAQIFFNLDRRGAAGEHEARLALASLRASASDMSLAGLGDGQMLDDTYRDVPMQEIAAMFGTDFAEALLQVDPGVWSGPMASGYGPHLVRLDSRAGGDALPLSEIRERVRSDWAYEQRQQANEAIYQQLRARYEVVVEAGDSGAAQPVQGENRP